MSIRVAVTTTQRRYRPDSHTAARYIGHVLRSEGKRKASVSLILVGSRLIRRLNRQFLRHDEVTDVLAFPLEEGKELEGEIYVNIDQARRQAAWYGVALPEEIARLIIHGTLHLVGYDDTSPAPARRMKTKEDHYVHKWFGKRGDG